MAENYSLQFAIRAVNEASDTIRQVSDDLGAMGQSATKSISGIASLMASQTLSAAADKISAIGTDIIENGREAQYVMAQLDATLKSTGRNAEFTSGELADMADELAMVAGQSDEDILAAETALLRFGNISKEMFGPAMQAALDLSAAGFGSVASQATMLGRALEAPERGARMLRAMNIILTESEQELIKSMMAAGDVAGAQELILKKVSEAYGNAAEAAGKTFTGAMGRLDVAIGNVKEALFEAFEPQLTELVNFLVDDVIPAIRSFAEWFAALPGPIRAAILALTGVTVGVAKIGPSLLGFVGLVQTVSGVLGGLGTAATAAGAGAAAAGAGGAAAAGGLGAAAAAGAAAAGPILVLVAAIGTLVAAIVMMGPTIVETWGGAFANLKVIISAFPAYLQEYLIPQISRVLQTLWQHLTTWVRDTARSIRDWASSIGRGFVEGIGQGIVDMYNWIIEVIRDLAYRILEEAKEALGIASPARATIPHGQAIMQGIGVGAMMEAPIVTRGIAGLLAAMPGQAMNMAFAPQPVRVVRLEGAASRFSRAELARMRRVADEASADMIELVLQERRR